MNTLHAFACGVLCFVRSQQLKGRHLKTVNSIPKDNYEDAIKLLVQANVKSSDVVYMARSLAGPMLSQVGQVFPEFYSVIYLLTSYKRRQVNHAYLAAKFGVGRVHDPDAVRHKLLFWRSKDLLEDAFGYVPDGFISSLERIGTSGHHPHIYTLLHQFMCESRDHAKAFRHSSKITPRTIEFMALMPDDVRSVRLAEKFTREKDVKALVFAVSMLSGDDPVKREHLCSRIKHAASNGGSIIKILEKEYHKTPFPAQVVPDSANLQFVGNADELVRVARDMKNCLAQ